MYLRVETRLDHPDHLSHISSGFINSEYKIFGYKLFGFHPNSVLTVQSGHFNPLVHTLHGSIGLLFSCHLYHEVMPFGILAYLHVNDAL